MSLEPCHACPSGSGPIRGSDGDGKACGRLRGEAMGIDDWFLTAAERGNSAFRLPPWSSGNRVVALVHGCAYFARLVEEVGPQRNQQRGVADAAGDAGSVAGDRRSPLRRG